MQFKLVLFVIFCTAIYTTGIVSQENSKIPDWFLKTETYQNEKYAVGISDPNLDTIAGENQAVLRALVNYSLLHKSHLNELSTYGLVNENSENNNAETLENAVYTCIFNNDNDSINTYKIVEKYTNIYKETFVLLKFSSDSLIKFDYKIIRRLGFQKENNIFPVFIDEIELIANLNDTLLCNYKLNKYVNKIKIKSNLIVDEEITKTKFLNKKYVYSSINIENNVEYLSNKLNYGVWASYFIGFIEKSSLFSNLKSSHIYNLSTVNIGGLRSNKESEDLINLSLSAKSISKSIFNFKIENIDIKSNNLNIKLDIEDKIKLENITEKELNRKEKKIFNKMLNQNWKCIGYNNIEHAWKVFKNYQNNLDESTIVSSDEHISLSLNSGIFKSVLFSKFDITNQLNSKIKSLTNISNSEKEASELKSSKTINLKKEIKLWPYFIFYRKINKKHYEIKTIFFYSAI